MLTKLIPDQIASFWDIIKYAIQQSLPPISGESPDKMNRLLSSALSGKIDVWASYTKNENNTFEGIVVTQFLYDDAVDMKNLLIYCIYGYADVSRKSWYEALEALVKYAKGNKCSQIIAYSSSPEIVSLANKLGADTSYTFISFDINKIV